MDTPGVRLFASISRLIEGLAEDNHDIWAQQRVGEGWTYGPQHDDANKQNPDLVPYAKLAESEKARRSVTARRRSPSSRQSSRISAR